ncbi:hypothetical protein [Amycolatopsis sp. NPDC004625]|uniref:hypothetical protein n=1 Tax=Amycolatopsis sp. NPDC004625 TaxID=3154670 RepID=UPI0033B0CA0D
MVDTRVGTIRAHHSLPRRAVAIVLGVDLNDRPPPARSALRGTSEPASARNHRPASVRTHRLSSLATAAAVSTVLVGVLATIASHLQPVPQIPGTQQPPLSTPLSSTNNAPSSPVPAVDNESLAKTELEQQVVNDQAEVEALLGSWVPELSAKKVGLVVSGTTFDYRTILAEYHHLVGVYPHALLLKSQDYTTFRLPDYWITVVAVPFPSAAAANGWCDSMRIGPSDCLAARLTHTPGSQGNTVTRNR